MATTETWLGWDLTAHSRTTDDGFQVMAKAHITFGKLS
jgi:hypothetical protein